MTVGKMADLDIEAMLEAPFKEAPKQETQAEPQTAAAPAADDMEKGESKKQSSSEKSKGKDKNDDRKDRDRKRSRSRSRDRKDKSRDKDRSRRRSRSRSRDRKRRSRSRDRDRRRSRSRSRDRRDRRRSRDRRSRSRDRSRRDRTPDDPNEKKIREYVKSLPEDARRKLDEEEDRAERSLLLMQMSVKTKDKDLRDFFMGNDVLCRDAKIIYDRISGRSKGIAYVELLKREDMPRALALSGQRINGVPIIIQYSQAEKNRSAGQQTVGPTKIYITNLLVSLAEGDVKAIFSPFGDIDKVDLLKDSSGRSRGMCYINFKKPECARLAIEQMNNFELGNQRLRVGWESDKTTLDSVDEDSERQGLALTATSRLELMHKLAGSRDGGMSVPPAPIMAAPIVAPPLMTGTPPLPPTTATRCLRLRNMFDPKKEDKEEGWDEDLHDDVEDECSNYGKVLHVSVDTASPEGAVYVKLEQATEAAAALLKLNGRWFDGQMIIAEHVPEEAYNLRFPNAPK